MFSLEHKCVVEEKTARQVGGTMLKAALSGSVLRSDEGCSGGFVSARREDLITIRPSTSHIATDQLCKVCTMTKNESEL